ncbi:MAG: glycosyltransferase family 2 protein [Anaerolineaceae bacterium]|nr:glycosyltransferase family 2 protein [Anaerolineaceae bacterium]
MNTPLLSIIFPAYNEESRLSKTLEQVHQFLEKQSYTSEILVVENGSSDKTLEIAQSYQEKIPYLRVMHEEQSGKGRAVRRGMQEARGEYRFFCDVDLSMPIEEVNHFIPPELPDSQIAIASREVKGAIRYDEPQIRHLVGRVFNSLVRILVLPKIHDSQCGFKCFRADISDEIFSLQVTNGWAFDVELLYIARKKGYQIKEIPIPWYYNAESKIRVIHDSVRMFKELLDIRLNDIKGIYD